MGKDNTRASSGLTRTFTLAATEQTSVQVTSTTTTDQAIESPTLVSTMASSQSADNFMASPSSTIVITPGISPDLTMRPDEGTAEFSAPIELVDISESEFSTAKTYSVFNNLAEKAITETKHGILEDIRKIQDMYNIREEYDIEEEIRDQYTEITKLQKLLNEPRERSAKVAQILNEFYMSCIASSKHMPTYYKIIMDIGDKELTTSVHMVVFYTDSSERIDESGVGELCYKHLLNIMQKAINYKKVYKEKGSEEFFKKYPLPFFLKKHGYPESLFNSLTSSELQEAIQKEEADEISLVSGAVYNSDKDILEVDTLSSDRAAEVTAQTPRDKLTFKTRFSAYYKELYRNADYFSDINGEGDSLEIVGAGDL